ncbi:MAG: DUF4215 domain-containing protein, partial [Patescibacteria group bacterium]
CGDGVVGKGEACEAGDPGCNDKCLNKGTITSANWCAVSVDPIQKNSTQCVGAVSVCGNGVVENNEECEVGSLGATANLCDVSCLLKDVCDFPLLKQCEKGTEGCNSDCTLAGASPLYGNGSLCGDGLTGTGEFGACENKDKKADSVSGSNPVQIITARGAKVTTESTQTTTIWSEQFNNATVKGSSEYSLQCGYREFDQPIIVTADGQNHPVYNDCPENSVGNYDNALGVGKNSCCLPRSKRSAEYPVDGAGFFGQPGVCRNTYISVEIPTAIKINSVAGNIQLAHGYTDETHVCLPGKDLTAVINEMLGDTTVAGQELGWLQKLWNNIKNFFAGIFGSAANASKIAAKDVRDVSNGKLISVWCAGEISFTTDVEIALAGTNSSSTIGIYLNNTLEKEDAYAVVLKGGAAGITDQNGVGIKSPDYTKTQNDVWFFQTGKDICKLKSVKVEPSGYLFNHPFATSSFFARTESIQGQQIVPTPAYDWAWHWGPINPIFDIPLAGTPANKTTATIGAKNVEGSLTGVVQAEVIKDISTEGDNHLGKSFNALFDLTAMFCANPWPGFKSDGSWIPYQDNKYNFSWSYCADGGSSMTVTDDLPYLQDPLYFLPKEDDIVKKCALENKICKLDADCDPTLLKSPAFGVFQLNVDGGVCWDSAKEAPYNNVVTTCGGPEECYVNGAEVDGVICQKDFEQFGQTWKNSCQASSFQFATPEILSGDTIKRLVFFNDVNEDAIGLQIFYNADNKSIDDWYTGHGFDLAGMQKTTIAGYEALSDGHNFYVNGLNFVAAPAGKGAIYKNIYLFSVNPSAQDETIAVVEQIMKSLKFNINLTDHNQCLIEDTLTTINTVRQNSDNITVNNKCTNDFDCRNELGAPLVGTNGVCSNVKTKFFRDLLARLPAIETAQTKISAYLDNNKNLPSFKGDLKGGSYIPGYTVSKWPSWGVLGGLVGGLPMDPINRWTKCDADDQQTCWKAADSIFSCPAFKSVYEYEFVPANKNYILHAPLEFFNLEDDIAKDAITENTFSLAPWCVGISISPFDETCGNGIVGPNEQCDPVGQIGYSKIGDTPTIAGTCQFAPNKACSEDSECGYYMEEPFIVSPSASVCGVGSKVVIGIGDKDATPVKNQFFACAADEDCKTAVTFGADVRLTTEMFTKSYSPPGSELFNVADFIAANEANLVCNTMDATTLATYKPQFCQNAVPGLEDQQCSGNDFAQKTCLSSCQWDYGICKSKNVCNNGIVEAGEVCDDGALNGGYGHCNDSCTGLFDSYCGDGKKDPSTPSKEFCDWSAAPWNTVPAYKYYGLKKENSCAWDCKGVGTYCGDGLKNGGEECDDANANANDDCTNICEENKFCALGNEVNKCLTDADCAQVKMDGGEVLDVFAKQNVCMRDGELLFSIADPGVPNLLSPVQCGVSADCLKEETYQAFAKGLKLYRYGAPDVVYYGVKNLITALGDNGLECLPASDTEGMLTISHSCVVLSELCGNGIKGATEQCDDGNTANNDGCSAECKIDVAAPVAKVKGCGSGAVDTYPEDPIKNEVCDLGAQNGVKCVPGYGQSCNYCAGDCKKVLTVDAKEFCGDGA